MNRKYTHQSMLLVTLLFLTAVVTSCKKSSDNPTPEVVTPVAVPIATIGLYEYESGADKRILIPISQVGTVAITTYYGVFDTGSTGMTIDADGLIPANMITTNGITFAGDSVNINGITITNKQSIMAYGDAISSTKEYGYLAYAPVTLGDANGKVTTKRIPFFMYYKVVDQNNKAYPTHSNDVFGVGPGTSYASNLIASPLSYFDIPAGGTNGFKLATLSSYNFDQSLGKYIVYTNDVLTIGLIPGDFTSGFIMHPLTYSSSGGYSPDIPATITYNGKSIAGNILFDTGTPSVTTIEDKTATAIGNLPVNTPVTITTNKGFTYSYVTTNTTNLTEVQNPNNTNDTRTIFSLDFFLSNEYLTDYANHQIGLKNN